LLSNVIGAELLTNRPGEHTGIDQLLAPAFMPSLTALTIRIFEEKGVAMWNLLRRLGRDDQGQDIAEYAVMLAVILVIVVGTLRLIGSNSNNAFSSVASSLQ
jgi:Flp pilus assembly pilin Flp